MPLYEYQCDACGAQFELIRKFSDPPLTICPTCGAEKVRKLVSSPAFQFKGSGWYVTDYARKSGEGSGTSGAKAAAEAKEAKADAKADTKSETSADTKAESKGSTTTDKPAAPAAAAPKDKP
jgi:putative FmdB family regulatory protein